MTDLFSAADQREAQRARDMADCYGVPDPTRAHARRSDPQTSHDAANSLTDGDLTELQAMVEAWFKAAGPPGATDQDLINAKRADGWVGSESTLRTRRKELVDLQRIKDTGRTKELPSGRAGTLWVHAAFAQPGGTP